MADRDIGPGENFQVSIVHAIRLAKAMILVFSANAANSDEIKKEVVLAGQSRLVVIPVRVEDVTPDEAFAYEMATRQWIDLFSDWEQSVQRLVRQLETVIHVKPDLKGSRGTPIVEQGPESHKEPSSPPVSEPAAASPLPPKPVVLSPRKLDWRLIAAPGVTAAVIATVLLFWLGPSFSHLNSSAPKPNLPLNQEVFRGHFDNAGSADFEPLNQTATPPGTSEPQPVAQALGPPEKTVNPATDTPAPPVVQPKAASDSSDHDTSSTAPPRSPAYHRGAVDWDSLQAWFNAQTGDRHAGAEFWAATRNAADHGSCNDAAATFDGDRSDFIAGCLDAKRLLDPIDEQRKDPDYRSGFNDEAQRSPLSSQSGSGAGNSPERYATVSKINLNLRAGPGPEYGSVAVMPEGTKVKIVRDADDGWKELEVQGAGGGELHGFANGAFLAPAPAPKDRLISH
jgi:hypothetical protein